MKKWFPFNIFWKHWCIEFIFHTQLYNDKIQVKFDVGQNPLINVGVMALFWLLFLWRKWFQFDIFWKHWYIEFIFYTQVYNHKIQVRVDVGQNPSIIVGVMALFRLYFVWRNGFRSISFESIGVLNSYFIHRYIIIKYRSRSMLGKIRRLVLELWPFTTSFHTVMVSVC